MATFDRQIPPLAIFGRFLRFGLLAWGGPVAQIAMIRHELVEKERWIEPARFNRLLAVYQALPGPEAHELCVHLGVTKGGRLGGLLAGLGFLLPGLLLVLALAWAYQRLDLNHPTLAALFLGVQVGVVAVIARAVHRIAGHVLLNRWLWVLGLAAAAATALGGAFWLVLPGAGLAYALISANRRFTAAVTIGGAALIAYALPSSPALFDPTTSAAGSVGALALFGAGLKAGLLTFGGAYTAIPFVRADTVGRGWVGEGQFLDGLALSGVIPAPLIIFATFVGYLAGGLPGALAITAGVFLPAFSFGLLFHDRLEQVVEDARLHHFLEGIAAGVIGLMAVTAVQLGWSLAQSTPSLAGAATIFAAALALLLLWRSNLSLPLALLVSAILGLLLLG